MKESALRDNAKEGLTALSLHSYKNIEGFRRIFGRDKENMSIIEIIDNMQSMELKTLNDLIEKSLKRAFPKSI